VSVGLSAANELQIRYALAALTRTANDRGIKIAQLKPPFIDSRQLVELATETQAVITAPAHCVRFDDDDAGSQQRKVADFLGAAGKAGSPVILTGNPELSGTFCVAAGDNLAAFEVPPVPVQELAPVAIRWEAEKEDGLGPRAQAMLSGWVVAGVQGLSTPEQDRILPIAAREIVKAWLANEQIDSSWVNLAVAEWLNETREPTSAGPKSPWGRTGT
jgi:hypothetical protein